MVFCTYCGQSFTRDEHLERHILTHTNTKPFKCFTCHMSFARRDLLQRHYTVHGRGQNTQEGLPSGNGITPKSADRSPITCSNCAKAKSKCDKKFPCSRCASHNLKCTLRPSRRVTKQQAGIVGAASSGSAESSSKSISSRETVSSENGPYTPVWAHEGQALSSAPSLISSSGTESSYPSTEGFHPHWLSDFSLDSPVAPVPPVQITSTGTTSPRFSEEGINIPYFAAAIPLDVLEEYQQTLSPYPPKYLEENDVIGAGGWAETRDSENVHTWFLEEPVYLEPYEISGKQKTKFSTSSPPPDPKIPRTSHDKRLKDYLINKLMRKANELLGYPSSEASQSCVSSDESSDTMSDGRPDSVHEAFQDVRQGEPTSLHSPSDAPDGGKTHAQGGTFTGSARSVEGSSFNSESKRKKDISDEGEENEDRGKKNKRRKGLQPSGDSKRTRRFACPFYRRNPELHSGCTSCVWPGFETIARTKEHIYRRHVNHVCPRCHESFESNDVLLNHLAQAERCNPVHEPLQQVGIDESQVQKLRLRLRGRIDEEKWRNIYRICHRLAEDAPTPSPYCDQDSLALQAVEGYDQFQRIHLPSRIRERLEAEADSNPEFVQLYEGLLSRLPDMIREVQMALYETYANLQRATAYPNQSRDQRNSPTNTNATTLTVLPQTELPALNTWRSSVTSPHVAFGPPPNTDDGMTLDEVRQIHTLSDEQRDKNSDSGYSTNLQANASSNDPQPETSLPGSSHPEGDHGLRTTEENPGMSQFGEDDPLSGFNFDPDSTDFDFDSSLFANPDLLTDFNPEFGG